MGLDVYSISLITVTNGMEGLLLSAPPDGASNRVYKGEAIPQLLDQVEGAAFIQNQPVQIFVSPPSNPNTFIRLSTLYF